MGAEVELTRRELYIDANPAILWEILHRTAGIGTSNQPEGALHLAGRSDVHPTEPGATGDGAGTEREVVFRSADRVSYRHLAGPLRGVLEEMVLHPTANGGVILGYSGRFEPEACDPLGTKARFDEMALEHMEDLKATAELHAGRGLSYPRPTDSGNADIGFGRLPHD